MLPREAVPLQTGGSSCDPKTGLESDTALDPWKNTKSEKAGKMDPVNPMEITPEVGNVNESG